MMADPKGNLVTPVGHRSDGSIRAFELSDTDRLLVSPIGNSIPRSILFQNLNLPAGTSTQTALTVPAGKVYRLTTASIAYTGTVAGVILYGIVNNTVGNLPFRFVAPPVSGNFYTDNLNILLGAGWSVGIIILGATLNDNIEMSVFCEELLT